MAATAPEGVIPMLIKADQSCQDRLSAAGAGIVTTEMVVFEWLGRAGTPECKELLEKIK